MVNLGPKFGYCLTSSSQRPFYEGNYVQSARVVEIQPLFDTTNQFSCVWLSDIRLFLYRVTIQEVKKVTWLTYAQNLGIA